MPVAASGAGSSADNSGRDWTDGADLVVEGDAFHVAGSPAGSTRSTRASVGYRLVEDMPWGVLSSYTVRMVTTNPLWSQIDDEVADIAEKIEWATGSSMSMGSPIGSHEGNTREITVEVGTDSPCGPLSNPGVLGCGGPFNQLTWTALGGSVWICSCLVGTSLLYSTILHEMGHSVGLDHYDEMWQGQYQVMVSFHIDDPTYYRSGDVSGLRRLGMNGYGHGTAPTHRPGPTPVPSVGDSGVAAARVTWPGAASYGLTIDHHEVEIENTTTGGSKTVTVGSSRSATIT